jgi:hypothetical protein
LTTTTLEIDPKLLKGLSNASSLVLKFSLPVKNFPSSEDRMVNLSLGNLKVRRLER